MDGYYGEIRAFTWGWAPEGWLLCNGTEIPVAQSQVLYAVIGNHFGGTPGRTFVLPDLRGHSPLGAGTGPGLTPRPNSSNGGNESVTLSQSTMPNHTHSPVAGGPSITANETAAPAADGTSYLSRLWDSAPNPAVPLNAYALAATTPVNVPFADSTVGTTGQGQPHENRQPLLVVNFCICNDGIFPVPAD